ncbi:MAG TPA: glucosyl-3-phosphoglycerate synthase [Anaerolineaceae bacterium]|nr:glucosyl-3-phosphoglycerate synthase [Anaerolineaceae bacterium]
MNTSQRPFVPFPHIAIPVLEEGEPTSAIRLACALGGQVTFVGLVCIETPEAISAGTQAARRLRKKMDDLRGEMGLNGPNRVRVSHTPWDDLQAALAEDPPDLLILEDPGHFECLGITPSMALVDPVCNTVLIHGVWPEQHQRVLVPLRGGPNADMALRLGLALSSSELRVIHLSPPGSQPAAEAPFRGLERVLPRLRGVKYEGLSSINPAQEILDQANRADLLVLGASARPVKEGGAIGPVLQNILQKAPCPVAVVSNRQPRPSQWTGPEGERAGSRAISLLVDKWFAENTYHADEFDHLERLVQLKEQQKVTISLALPALDEEETVGEVISTIQDTLIRQYPLLDEMILIDSNSSDRTREIASKLEVPVYIHQELLPAHGSRAGKGEALWKSLYVTHGDIILWIDTDIVNIHPRFVYGVLGPLLLNPHLQFVKGFYQRPLRSGEKTQATGGGRVTELIARPLLNLFYPELSGVIQPLSGEYGGRRAALEQMPFFSGYGVETGLLIDVFEKYGLSAIAQVDLLERVHHNQSLEALSKMSFVILQAFIRKLERRYNVSVLEEVNKSMKLIHYEDGNYYLQIQEVVERERPPMLEIPEYVQRQTSKQKDSIVGGT